MVSTLWTERELYKIDDLLGGVREYIYLGTVGVRWYMVNVVHH